MAVQLLLRTNKSCCAAGQKQLPEPIGWGKVFFGDTMDVKCQKCHTIASVPDKEIPIGRSYIVCPKCDARINIFKGFPEGAIIENLTNLRFMSYDSEFEEHFCEPGELWRVIEVITPCPDKGKGKACELENRGRCPNQRLVIKHIKDKAVYKSCLYRKRRRIFDPGELRVPVGRIPDLDALYEEEDDKTYRIR